MTLLFSQPSYTDGDRSPNRARVVREQRSDPTPSSSEAARESTPFGMTTPRTRSNPARSRFGPFARTDAYDRVGTNQPTNRSTD